jgi:hypothetical protein
MVSQILRLMLCIDFRGRGLLHKIFTFLSILVPSLCMLYHNLYRMFSCYLPSTAPLRRYLLVYSCSYPDVDSLSSERMLHKDYERKCSVGPKYWSWVSRGLSPRGIHLRSTARREVTLTLMTYWVNPVTEVSSFYGTQQSRCLPLHLGMETDPASETLFFL